MQKKAVILFSGGLDSTTCLKIAESQGFIPYALSIYYGQKHRFELEAAANIAKLFNIEHKTLFISQLTGSSLTDDISQIPDFNHAQSHVIPSTYVPARNTIFLSLALGWAETLNAFDIFYGANIVDYSGYPDCRPEYLHAFETMANLATKAGVEGAHYNIHAPLLKLTKADIIQKGISLGINYGMTVSCYRLDNKLRACGSCDSCTYRKKGFTELGIADPTIYQS